LRTIPAEWQVKQFAFASMAPACAPPGPGGKVLALLGKTTLTELSVTPAAVTLPGGAARAVPSLNPTTPITTSIEVVNLVVMTNLLAGTPRNRIRQR
jgi:hypothetical protein